MPMCILERQRTLQLHSLPGWILPSNSLSLTPKTWNSRGAAGFSPCWETEEAGSGVRETECPQWRETKKGKQKALPPGNTYILPAARRQHWGEAGSCHQRERLWAGEPETRLPLYIPQTCPRQPVLCAPSRMRPLRFASQESLKTPCVGTGPGFSPAATPELRVLC